MYFIVVSLGISCLSNEYIPKLYHSHDFISPFCREARILRYFQANLVQEQLPQSSGSNFPKHLFLIFDILSSGGKAKKKNVNHTEEQLGKIYFL